MESNEITTMRAMAWGRAKGELKSILVTFYPEYEGNKVISERYTLAKSIIDEFVEND